ncbi:MAG: hypothetical protein E6G90_19590 [Alphaproteobacteria bacterium]|nr:MAG: hypothetical protein E6G90_19590 [Alphaproteobacteria bacterium]
MQAGLVAWRRGLDAGTDRQTGTGVVADDRLVGGAAGKRQSRPLGVPDNRKRIGHWRDFSVVKS